MCSRASINVGNEGTRVLKNNTNRPAIRPANTHGGKHDAVRQTSLSERLKVFAELHSTVQSKETFHCPSSKSQQQLQRGKQVYYHLHSQILQFTWAITMRATKLLLPTHLDSQDSR